MRPRFMPVTKSLPLARITTVGRFLQQRKVALRRIEAEGEPGLDDQVEPLLQLVGDAEIPHRRGNQHPIGEREAHRHALEHGESVALGVAEFAARSGVHIWLPARRRRTRAGFAPEVHLRRCPSSAAPAGTGATNASAPAADSEAARGEQRRWNSLGTPASLSSHRPGAHPNAPITASALVTTATFCIAKLIEALCHSAFIVEQQSSGTIMK